MTSFMVLGRHLSQAEEERIVRAYHCTSLASFLLNLKAEGYLSITNKRVIFYAHGTSFSGKSIMHSEVPIEDVSGINTYKGTYFSITHLIGAFFASFLLGGFIGGVVSAIVSFVISILRKSFEFNSVVIIPIVLAILGFIFIYRGRNHATDNIKRPIFISIGAALMAGLGGIGMIAGIAGSLLGANSAIGALSSIIAILAFFAVLYALYNMFLYAKRETMSLTIGSKGGSNTPIEIAGVSILGIFNTAALSALNAEPAMDADRMIREIGAVINDIQSLGELGVEKWRKGR